jgi:Family of unknown function (DUF6527)
MTSARATAYTILGTVLYHSEAAERVRTPGDCVIVERGGVQRQLVMKCPDGCGEIISVNLDRRSGPAWRLYYRRGKWSLFPSIDKPSGCESHFILAHGRIIWSYSDWYDDSISERLDEVRHSLTHDRMTSFVEIADRFDAIPWDVLTACRALVRRGLAEEGTGRLSAHFQLTTDDPT